MYRPPQTESWTHGSIRGHWRKCPESYKLKWFHIFVIKSLASSFNQRREDMSLASRNCKSRPVQSYFLAPVSVFFLATKMPMAQRNNLLLSRNHSLQTNWNNFDMKKHGTLCFVPLIPRANPSIHPDGGKKREYCCSWRLRELNSTSPCSTFHAPLCNFLPAEQKLERDRPSEKSIVEHFGTRRNGPRV